MKTGFIQKVVRINNIKAMMLPNDLIAQIIATIRTQNNFKIENNKFKMFKAKWISYPISTHSQEIKQYPHSTNTTEL